ncbi:hypothetical protein [Stenotrophomonas sp. 24(2023)]|uniref:hypothetical protein n=1 Tax=Stenotrophomonas sp. 24(2023) TaxID=3068324 RepID=UPI0027E19A00|nr:hypothetical protein [Stenotrophomonas sp. 24(2023)]WMJ69225.1 hypothetical protein Q9R17_18945 [Stenotrophomonas sp. 24(2023)]
MDRDVVATERTGGLPEAQALSFSWLYQQVQAYVDQSIYPKASRLEQAAFRYAIAAAILGILVGLFGQKVIPSAWALVIAIVCLAVEIGGMLLAYVLMLRREWRQYATPRLNHAAEMDGDFACWLQVINQLRSFPRQQREQRLRFATTLRQRMGERMGLMYGGMDKLGPFPLLIALYLQFRGWEWGDWAGAFDVNLVTGVLLLAIFMMYGAGLLLVAIRIRLDTYIGLLQASLEEQGAGQ